MALDMLGFFQYNVRQVYSLMADSVSIQLVVLRLYSAPTLNDAKKKKKRTPQQVVPLSVFHLLFVIFLERSFFF